jgi:hypothetical protein
MLGKAARQLNPYLDPSLNPNLICQAVRACQAKLLHNIQNKFVTLFPRLGPSVTHEGEGKGEAEGHGGCREGVGGKVGGGEGVGVDMDELEWMRTQGQRKGGARTATHTHTMGHAKGDSGDTMGHANGDLRAKEDSHCVVIESQGDDPRGLGFRV